MYKKALALIGTAAVLLILAGAFCGAAAAAEDTAADPAAVTDIYDEAALREAVTQPDFNVRLCADIRLTDYYKTGRDNSLVVTKSGTIDLNGHTLLYAGKDSRQSGDNNGAVIVLKAGELTVKDGSSAQTGKITGGIGMHPLMGSGNSYLFGGGVYVAGGAHLILNGGSISDNRIDNGRMVDAAGAGVYADRYGKVTMNGGSITNNYASAINGYAAGVHIRRGTFTMTDGIISGNIAVSQNNRAGGGVYLWDDATFIMTGGIISGNSAARGGGVYVDSRTHFSVSGNSSIMDNSKDDVALVDGPFRTIPKGILNLIGPLSGTVLVVPDDRYRGPSFGTVSGGASDNDAKHIINKVNRKYAVKNEKNELVWGTAAFSGTLITLNWNDKDRFYGEKIGHVAAFRGETTSFPITPISMAGSSLTGWYLPESTTLLIDVNGKLQPGVKVGETEYTDANGKWIYAGDTLTLIAGWNHDGTLLTLDGNGGTPTSQTVKVEEGSTTVTYTPPTRTDSGSQITYTFCGWFLDRACTKQLIDMNGKLAKGMSPYTDNAGKWIYDKTTLTLYAGWYADGTELTLNGNGGDPAAQTVSVAYGAKEVSGISLSVMDGYACTGWYIEGIGNPVRLINRDGTLEKSVTVGGKAYTDAEGKWIYDAAPPELTLYADWITDVTYYKGDEIYDKRNYQHGQVIHQPGEGMDIPKAPEPVDSFIGWRVGSTGGPFIFFYQGDEYQFLTPSPYYDGNYKWTASAETLKLYAAMLAMNGEGPESISLLTVTYNANGADSGRIPKETEWYAPGDDVPVCENTGALEKYGYAFSGWNTRADGTGTSYAAGSTITNIRENTTLYAMWKEKTPKPFMPDDDGYALIWEEVAPKYPENSIIILSADNVSPEGITIGPVNPAAKEPEKADGSAKNKVYAVFDMKAQPKSGEGDSVNITIEACLSPGEKPGNVCLRHYTGTPGFGKWDSEAIRPEIAEEDPHLSGWWTFVFDVKEFSPFALTYEVPSEKSSKSQGTSVWATTEPTETPTATPTPTPTETPGAVETPSVKPVATETPTPAKSPAPFMGLLAGLGAAAAVAVLRMRRR